VEGSVYEKEKETQKKEENNVEWSVYWQRRKHSGVERGGRRNRVYTDKEGSNVMWSMEEEETEEEASRNKFCYIINNIVL